MLGSAVPEMAAFLEAAVSNAPLQLDLDARYQASASRNVVSIDELDQFLISLLRHAPNCANEAEYTALLAKAATAIDRVFLLSLQTREARRGAR